MSLEDYPHVKPSLKEEIQAMSDAEIIIAIEQAPSSMRAWPVPFMKAVLAERHAKRESLREERETTQAEKTQENASRAYRLSVLALAVSLVAIVVSLVKGA